MFSAMLREKVNIEMKVSNLQRSYLGLLQAPVREIEYSNNSQKAREIILQKLADLEVIRDDYLNVLKQHKQLSEEIVDAKESAEELEDLVDRAFASFNLEIPEDLEKRASTPHLMKQERQSDCEEDKENGNSTFSCGVKQEEEDDSDKENSQIKEENSFASDSDEYFSPNVQIQKSNSDCYTPAIKTQSKLRMFKRQL